MKEYPYLFGVKDEQEMRELHDSGKDYTKTFYGSAVANEAVQRGVPLKDVLRFIRDYDEIRGNKHYIGEYDMNRLSRNNMPQNKADERAMEMDFENSVQPVEGIRQEVDKDIGDDVPRRFLKGSRWKAKTPVERQELYRMLGADR